MCEREAYKERDGEKPRVTETQRVDKDSGLNDTTHPNGLKS